MLKKLMKYEFMATGRIFLPLFAALIIVSVVNRLLSYLPARAPSVIGTVVSVILMAGISVLALILTLQRFRNNLLSSEGYLMMTLPVKTDILILSKMFVAAIWVVASIIVVALSIMILAMTNFNFSDFVEALRNFGEAVAREPLRFVVCSLEAVVLIAFTTFSGILMLYACMALSMLVDKRRGLFTFAAFIVISTALQVIFVIIGVVADSLNIGSVFRSLFGGMDSFGQSQIMMLVLQKV